MSEKLKPIRDRIDTIDDEIQRLLNERADAALAIAKLKESEQGDRSAVYYRPEREAAILNRLRQSNSGPLSNDDIARLYREIISCCLALEQPLTIAYLGPPGTYTESAAIKQFGHFVTTRAHSSIDEVFREVETEAAHYGVVPVENSTEGMVNHTLDCFLTSSLMICSEIQMPIHHALMVHMRSDIKEVQEIYSHEQSFAQCRRWLDTNYPNVTRTPVHSNAEAARLAAESEGTAAIAGEMAAERYGLRVVETHIEDEHDNVTRFLVIGQQEVQASGRDKSSILVSTQNEPGALFQVLEPFHRHEISLTRIETRPSKSGSWTYVFFIDFDGHHNDPKIQKVIAEVEKVALEVRTLGSYPQAVG